MKKIVMLAVLSAAISGCDDQGIEGAVDGTAYGVSVYLNGKDQGSVNIFEHEAKFETVTVGEQSVRGVSVAAMIEAVTGIGASELGGYLCDYEAADGFRPSSKGDRCPMVSCAYAAESYIDVASKRLVYGEGAPMKDGPGCYGVDALTKILIYPAD
ncbi:MAG: hypothetical protein IJ165_01805 [Proteobacteria bacterium]|nr:hypothetical protein [Pseudomonadota bacterium]